MFNNISYIDLENLDTTQLIDGLELSTILSCGGVLMLDSKNPTEDTLVVVYVDTGSLKMSKVKL